MNFDDTAFLLGKLCEKLSIILFLSVFKSNLLLFDYKIIDKKLVNKFL